MLEGFWMGVSLWVVGVLGVVLNSSNLMMMVMSMELMWLAVVWMFLSGSVLVGDVMGQVFPLMVLTVAAAESAMGLGMFVVYYRVSGTMGVSSLNLLSG